MSRAPTQAIFVVENLTRSRVIAACVRSANRSAERRRGLLDTKELDENAGLWINPCEAIHTFGMLIPLDVVFLDARFRVKKISAQLRPNRIAVCLPATSVLEIKAGGAAASGTECGDQLLFRHQSESEALSTAPTDTDR